MKKLFSEKGMSLASVTIAAGLMATLGLAVMKMSQNAQQVSSKMTSDFNLNTYKQNIERVLNLPDNAQDFLVGQNIGGLAGANVNICARSLREVSAGPAPAGLVLARNTRFFNDDDNPFLVADIADCMYFQQDPGFNAAASPQTIAVLMVIKITRDSVKQQMGGTGSSLIVNLTVALDAANNIMQVWASDMDAELAACNSMRGQYDNVARFCNNSWVSNPGSLAPAPAAPFGGMNRIQADFFDAETDIATYNGGISSWSGAAPPAPGAGNIQAMNAITAVNGDITADGADVVADQNVIARNADITAQSGSVIANQEVRAQNGNITAESADVVASQNVIAQNADITAQAGSVIANQEVRAQNGNITAESADVVASQNVIAQNADITAQAGSVIANQEVRAQNGNITALAADVIAAQNVTAQSGDVKADSGNVIANQQLKGNTLQVDTDGNIDGNLRVGGEIRGNMVYGDTKVEAPSVIGTNEVCIGGDCTSTWNIRYLNCTPNSGSSCGGGSVVTAVEYVKGEFNSMALSHSHSFSGSGGTINGGYGPSHGHDVSVSGTTGNALSDMTPSYNTLPVVRVTCCMLRVGPYS